MCRLVIDNRRDWESLNQFNWPTFYKSLQRPIMLRCCYYRNSLIRHLFLSGQQVSKQDRYWELPFVGAFSSQKACILKRRRRRRPVASFSSVKVAWFASISSNLRAQTIDLIRLKLSDIQLLADKLRNCWTINSAQLYSYLAILLRRQQQRTSLKSSSSYLLGALLP